MWPLKDMKSGLLFIWILRTLPAFKDEFKYIVFLYVFFVCLVFINILLRFRTAGLQSSVSQEPLPVSFHELLPCNIKASLHAAARLDLFNGLHSLKHTSQRHFSFEGKPFIGLGSQSESVVKNRETPDTCSGTAVHSLLHSLALVHHKKKVSLIMRLKSAELLLCSQIFTHKHFLSFSAVS